MKYNKDIEKLFKKFTENTISRKELDRLLSLLAKSKEEELDPLKVLLKRKLEGEESYNQVGNRNKVREKLKARMKQEAFADPLPATGSTVYKVKRKNLAPYKVAAVLMLAFVASITWYFFRSKPIIDPGTAYQVYQTVSRQKSTITLPDGSVVKLNSESTLTYPEEFTDDVRKVQLEGEAFFEVARSPDKPFLVRSGKVTTTVLGTSFNIRAYPDDKDITIAVATGKVSIMSQDNEKQLPPLTLTPNEVASYNLPGKTLTKTPQDISDIIAWKDGLLILNDKNLSEVAKLLEKWYGTKITIENQSLRYCLVRGKFNDPSLQQVLEALKFVHGIEYDFNHEEVILRGKGCTNGN